ncbi:unnamed protein product [Sphagnum troendelagicum]|uniref:Uncharacterized protein n=1 Tax=Sphagnum troendelagicum TaxID=128251 RepID=A0ABP0U272_9BRYO
MRKQKHEGPTGATVSGTPVHEGPVLGSPVNGSPAATKPYVGPPAYAPGRELLLFAPPCDNNSAAPPPAHASAASSSPALVDQEAGHPAQKSRIKQNRKCRDIVFLLLFLVFGIGFIIESSFGLNKGDPSR